MSGDIAAIIAASASLLLTIGGAAKFLWDKLEKRFVEIENRARGCEKRSGVQDRVIELLVQEVQRALPGGSPVLTRALKLLTDMKEAD